MTNSLTQDLSRRHFFLPDLFLLRLDSWESADTCVDLVLNGTRQCQNLFLVCWQSSFNEFALQQLPKQSQWAECLQCWDSKALILGKDIRHSLSFHLSTETLFSFYVTRHIFEWLTNTDCLGLHRLKCGPPVFRVSLFAGYIQFASPTLGLTSGVQASTGCTQLFPPGSSIPPRRAGGTGRESRLAEVDLTRAEVARGMSKSWRLICSSLEWFIPWPSNGKLARALISRYPSFLSHQNNFMK